MNKQILKEFENKKITILGFGLEGKSSYKFIRKYFPNMNLDIRTKMPVEDKVEDDRVNYIAGEEYLNDLDKYDVILKSPGISFKDIDTTHIKGKILTQLELFLKYSNCITIGITGTKGKSTTSSLIYKCLKDQGKNVHLIGNIGIPPLDEIDVIEENSYAVIEMSSHALEFTKVSSNISILLNIYEEHLDHYNTYKDYAMAKFNIFKYQKDEDYAIFNLDNETMNSIGFKYKEHDYAISINNNENTKTKNTINLKEDIVYLNGNKVYDKKYNRKIKGEHNLNNIMFVLAVGNILNLDLSKTIKSISEFNPLEHRLEYVGKFDGIEYYNDSIATIPESAMESIKALKNVNTLLVGGKDRGVDLNKLIEFLKTSNIENFICLPRTGEYIANGLKETNKNVIQVKTMPEAVEIAKKVTKKDTICLLSPAASSYGYFKNFEERGSIFKDCVKKK